MYVCERMQTRAGGGAESREGAGQSVVTRPMMNGSAIKTKGVLCHALHLELLVHVHRLLVQILLAP